MAKKGMIDMQRNPGIDDAPETGSGSDPEAELGGSGFKWQYLRSRQSE